MSWDILVLYSTSLHFDVLFDHCFTAGCYSCTSTTFGVTRACSVEDFGVSDLVTQILSVVRFSRYIFDHWLRAFFIGLCATQIFKGWRMWSMKRNMHYLDNDVSGDCSLINWDNALLVKFLILLPCNQL